MRYRYREGELVRALASGRVYRTISKHRSVSPSRGRIVVMVESVEDGLINTFYTDEIERVKEAK